MIPINYHSRGSITRQQPRLHRQSTRARALLAPRETSARPFGAPPSSARTIASCRISGMDAPAKFWAARRWPMVCGTGALPPDHCQILAVSPTLNHHRCAQVQSRPRRYKIRAGSPTLNHHRCVRVRSGPQRHKIRRPARCRVRLWARSPRRGIAIDWRPSHAEVSRRAKAYQDL